MPNAAWLMAFGLLGRLHLPAVPIALTFLVADWTGAYVTGGVLGAAMLVGQGIAGPLRGRAADRQSRPKLLLKTVSVHATGLAALSLLAQPGVLDPQWWPALAPVATITGLFLPPVGPVMRAIWPEICGRQAREAAYAIEATLQELLFIVAPVLVAFLIAFAGPVVAGLACAGTAAVGAAAFAVVLSRSGLAHTVHEQHTDTGRRTTSSLFTTPGFAALLVFGALLVAGLVMTDLVMIGWARERGEPALAGVLAAVWAFGSLTGGLVMGGRSGAPRLWRRALASAAGLVVLVPALPPVAGTGEPWVVCVILFLGGAAIAPTLAAANSRLADTVPVHRRTEAFGWFTTATTAGATAASPIAGAWLDSAGPAAAAGTAALFVLCAALLVLRHRNEAHNNEAHNLTTSPGGPAQEHTVTP
ncbi:MFS transporter [Allosaccharopolyspora coralli]|uniref:MFS transporter n=1 Tax=Allosaccharopolyspora coralli TaxID=2665642 RepID=UPI001E44876C|nr:MFS transporter [Allosaccharopolyspora coralli]